MNKLISLFKKQPVEDEFTTIIRKEIASMVRGGRNTQKVNGAVFGKRFEMTIYN